MAKVGRNHPCPCGSGKKYKKCCMKKQAVVSAFDLQDQKDFSEFLPRLIDYSKHHNNVVKPAYQKNTAAFEVLSKADQKAFSQLIFHWSLYNALLLDSNETILQRFVDEHQSRYSKQFLTFLNKWIEMRPGMFVVTEKKENSVILKEKFDQTAYIPDTTEAMRQLSEGDLLLGYLYPTFSGYSLGMDALIVPGPMQEEFLQKWDEFYTKTKKQGETKADVFTNAFPAALQLLSSILTGQPSELLAENEKIEIEEEEEEEKVNETETLSEQGQAVLDLLREQTDSKNYASQLVAKAEQLWANFYTETQPRIQKPETFAGALDYWMTKQQEGPTGMTQKSIAEKYGVSPGTISNRFKDIQAFAKEKEEALVTA